MSASDLLQTLRVVEVTTSEIRCDTDGCTTRPLAVSRDIDEPEAAIIARAAGWSTRSGSLRDYHWCPAHRQEQP